MPFTTPVLAGTRLRRARSCLELVVPHPAGGRGVYLMGCSELPHFCAPTMHDLKLADQIAGLQHVTPRNVRAAAWAVAAQGFAGHAASRAATAALQTERLDHAMATSQLLHKLVHQRNGIACAPADLPVRAKAALVSISKILGRSAAALTADIDGLARVCAGIALGAANPTRCDAAMKSIAALIGAIEEIPETALGQGHRAAALVLSAARATLAIAQAMQAQTHQHLTDITSLLAQWATAQDRLRGMILAQEWLLDGWAHTCLIWNESSIAARRGALSEMAFLVPVIPTEAGELSGVAVNEAERQHLRALVLSARDWRACVTGDLIARNERILGQAA